jgi:hypothetical protein
VALSRRQFFRAAALSAAAPTGIFDLQRWDPVEEKLVTHRVQDVEPVLVANQASMRQAEQSPLTGDMRRVARIPTVLLEKWLREEGIDFNTKQGWKRVLAKLDDPEYVFLRTSPGTIGRGDRHRIYSVPSSSTKVEL